MSLSMNITVPEERMREFLSQAEGDMRQRRVLNRMVANRAEVFTADYIRRIARTRHRSSQRLGAAPSGHLERAAESVTGGSDEREARVSITSPGFSRVAGPVTIRPKAARWLTIPIHRRAYNKRARAVARELGTRLFRPGPRGAKKRVLSAVDPSSGRLVHYFALVRQVTLPQDRTLLPTDEAYDDVVRAGARDYVETLLRRVS